MRDDVGARLRLISPSLREPLVGVPFEDVIRELYGQEVLQFDPLSARGQSTAQRISVALRDVCATVQQNPIIRPRPNEVGKIWSLLS